MTRLDVICCFLYESSKVDKLICCFLYELSQLSQFTTAACRPDSVIALADGCVDAWAARGQLAGDGVHRPTTAAEDSVHTGQRRPARKLSQ